MCLTGNEISVRLITKMRFIARLTTEIVHQTPLPAVNTPRLLWLPDNLDL